jgi:vacuolar iron transporter family protein
LPYILLSNYVLALGILLITVILIILVFTYYVSVAKDLPFKKRFLEMVTISMSVALVSFLIGIVVKQFLGISV